MKTSDHIYITSNLYWHVLNFFMSSSCWAELFNIWTWSKNILIISSSEFLFCESTRVTLNDSHASLSVSLWGNEKKNSLNGGSEPRSRDVKMVWDHVWGSHVEESPVMWCVRKVWQTCVSYRSSWPKHYTTLCGETFYHYVEIIQSDLRNFFMNNYYNRNVIYKIADYFSCINLNSAPGNFTFYSTTYFPPLVKGRESCSL